MAATSSGSMRVLAHQRAGTCRIDTHRRCSSIGTARTRKAGCRRRAAHRWPPPRASRSCARRRSAAVRGLPSGARSSSTTTASMPSNDDPLFRPITRLMEVRAFCKWTAGARHLPRSLCLLALDQVARIVAPASTLGPGLRCPKPECAWPPAVSAGGSLGPLHSTLAVMQELFDPARHEALTVRTWSPDRRAARSNASARQPRRSSTNRKEAGCCTRRTILRSRGPVH